MKRLALAAAILAALLAPATASALPGTLAEDIVIAEAFWGRQPEQCSTVEWGWLPPTTTGRGGEATRPEPGYYGPCTVRMLEGMPIDYLCAGVVHEYGHLLGEGHSEDPASVMWGGPGPIQVSSVPACELPPPSEWVPHRRWKAFRRGHTIHGPHPPRMKVRG